MLIAKLLKQIMQNKKIQLILIDVHFETIEIKTLCVCVLKDLYQLIIGLD